jgi:HTH-type transcriptional regulator/antitoxin HigA
MEQRAMEIRPIRTKADHKAALADIDRLTAGDREPAAGSADADRLEVLIALVHDYETRHYPIEPPDPVEAIKFRMEQAGLSRRELEGAIGGNSRVSEILNRRRPLTLRMIRRLHHLLGIPAESLIREYDAAG